MIKKIAYCLAFIMVITVLSSCNAQSDNIDANTTDNEKITGDYTDSTNKENYDSTQDSTNKENSDSTQDSSTDEDYVYVYEAETSKA